MAKMRELTEDERREIASREYVWVVWGHYEGGGAPLAVSSNQDECEALAERLEETEVDLWIETNWRQYTSFSVDQLPHVKNITDAHEFLRRERI